MTDARTVTPRRSAARRLLRLAGSAALLAAAAAGAGYATSSGARSSAATQVVHACVKGNGQVRIVASASACRTPEHPLAWNVAGPAGPQGPRGEPGPRGADGASVAAATLAAGDPNCPFGGSSFSVGGTTTYACSGAPGPAGADGRDGVDGSRLTSFDGLAGLSCTNAGRTGAISISYATSGAATLTCVVQTGNTGGGTTTRDSGAPCSATLPPYPNGTVSCSGGVYRYTCLPGFADLDGQLGDGCEVDLATDVRNCGFAGNDLTNPILHAAFACEGGGARLLACDPGWEDLDGNPADGCEYGLPDPDGETADAAG
ncbi:MAG TPA: hypothetical protein VFJ77_05050 [Gaiellaceae bacterium]|nr:hypothetical protein [Gaiellaceae bacterium]